MARKLTKEEEERKTFEFLVSLTAMVVVPGSIQQNPPPSPDIECQIEGMGPMAFELVALDAEYTRTRLNQWRATREIWDRALRSWPEKEQKMLLADCGNISLSLSIDEKTGTKARTEIMKEIQARLLTKEAGFKGELFEQDDDYPEGLEGARTFRDEITDGPRIYAPSAGPWLAPQIDKIREKLAEKNYRTERPLELIAYATHDEADGHVNSLAMIDECVQRHLAGSRFRRVWVFNRHFGQLVHVYPPVAASKQQ